MSGKKAHFEELLQQPKINRTEFNKLCFQGIPDGCGIRSVSWKILLNYLPYDTTCWDEVLEKQRTAYQTFIKTMIVDPTTSKAEEDHPLNTSTTSTWSEYFKDNEVLGQIDKDVRRLCPDLSFFQQATKYPSTLGREALRTRVQQAHLQSMQVTKSKTGSTQLASTRKKNDDDGFQELPEGQEAHWEVCGRMLFIFALLNPGIAYVQGMNEILGPIYYTFVTDAAPGQEEWAEADSFFCFTGLMSEIKDHFIKILDFSQCGISHCMDKLMMLLKDQDLQLYEALDNRSIKPQFFSFRWLTLLLSQEFLYPEIQRLWDSFFADESRFDFMLYFCCAMLVAQRTRLINGDFIDNMKVLQRYPPETDIYTLLQLACQIRDNKLVLTPVPSISDTTEKPSKSTYLGSFLGFGRRK